jgi:hypothetical protein
MHPRLRARSGAGAPGRRPPSAAAEDRASAADEGSGRRALVWMVGDDPGSLIFRRRHGPGVSVTTRSPWKPAPRARTGPGSSSATVPDPPACCQRARREPACSPPPRGVTRLSLQPLCALGRGISLIAHALSRRHWVRHRWPSAFSVAFYDRLARMPRRDVAAGFLVNARAPPRMSRTPLDRLPNRHPAGGSVRAWADKADTRQRGGPAPQLAQPEASSCTGSARASTGSDG